MSQNTQQRAQLTQAKRWVVKIGSALMTLDGKGIAKDDINHWVAQLAEQIQLGRSFVLVSSGAVAEGMARLNMSERPATLHELQATAAVGQMGLIQTWEQAFAKHDIRTAQVLLTHDDLKHRRRYLNAKSTLSTLMSMGVVPIVNENDTVATDEIRFGDNDSLAAMVSNLIEADALAILTDQDGLFNADPRKNPSATLIQHADADDSTLSDMAGDGGKLGRGGMITKVLAAQKAACAGAHTLIANGREKNVLTRLMNGETLGTLLSASEEPITAKKQWMASQLHAQGSIKLDTGAERALIEQGKSLLPVGVTHIDGDFQRGDLVLLMNSQGKEIARGLSNYSSEDAHRIKGLSSDQISQKLGHEGNPELVHRDNLVLI